MLICVQGLWRHSSLECHALDTSPVLSLCAQCSPPWAWYWCNTCGTSREAPLPWAHPRSTQVVSRGVLLLIPLVAITVSTPVESGTCEVPEERKKEGQQSIYSSAVHSWSEEFTSSWHNSDPGKALLYCTQAYLSYWEVLTLSLYLSHTAYTTHEAKNGWPYRSLKELFKHCHDGQAPLYDRFYE